MYNNNLYELIPINSRQASFYKKAHYTIVNNEATLYSYTSNVCKVDLDRGAYYLNWDIPENLLFSRTTLKHLKEFLKQKLGVDIKSKKELTEKEGLSLWN